MALLPSSLGMLYHSYPFHIFLPYSVLLSTCTIIHHASLLLPCCCPHILLKCSIYTSQQNSPVIIVYLFSSLLPLNTTSPAYIPFKRDQFYLLCYIHHFTPLCGTLALTSLATHVYNQQPQGHYTHLSHTWTDLETNQWVLHLSSYKPHYHFRSSLLYQAAFSLNHIHAALLITLSDVYSTHKVSSSSCEAEKKQPTP